MQDVAKKLGVKANGKFEDLQKRVRQAEGKRPTGFKPGGQERTIARQVEKDTAEKDSPSYFQRCRDHPILCATGAIITGAAVYTGTAALYTALTSAATALSTGIALIATWAAYASGIGIGFSMLGFGFYYRRSIFVKEFEESLVYVDMDNSELRAAIEKLEAIQCAWYSISSQKSCDKNKDELSKARSVRESREEAAEKRAKRKLEDQASLSPEKFALIYGKSGKGPDKTWDKLSESERNTLVGKMSVKITSTKQKRRANYIVNLLRRKREERAEAEKEMVQKLRVLGGYDKFEAAFDDDNASIFQSRDADGQLVRAVDLTAKSLSLAEQVNILNRERRKFVAEHVAEITAWIALWKELDAFVNENRDDLTERFIRRFRSYAESEIKPDSLLLIEPRDLTPLQVNDLYKLKLSIPRDRIDESCTLIEEAFAKVRTPMTEPIVREIKEVAKEAACFTAQKLDIQDMVEEEIEKLRKQKFVKVGLIMDMQRAIAKFEDKEPSGEFVDMVCGLNVKSLKAKNIAKRILKFETFQQAPKIVDE